MSETSEKTSWGNKDNLIPWQWLKNWQPDPALKKAGRERRRNWKKIMDLVLQYQSMTKDQLQKLAGDPNATMLELLMVKYITGWMKDTRILIDFIDRHVPKAPQKTELSWIDWDPINVNLIKDASDDELIAMLK